MPLAHHRPPPELLKKLGENVRRLRRAKDYTQEELAELIDVHPRMVQKIEFGETNILATTAMRLRAALDCSWDDLMPPVEVQKPKRSHKKPDDDLAAAKEASDDMTEHSWKGQKGGQVLPPRVSSRLVPSARAREAGSDSKPKGLSSGSPTPS